jgi:GMP synthase-like glutamine amidotransferase
VFDLGVPVLGICYGMQTMAQQLGGRWRGLTREFGYAEVRSPASAGCSMGSVIGETRTAARCWMCG